jgi:hypothetical protein
MPINAPATDTQLRVRDWLFQSRQALPGIDECEVGPGTQDPRQMNGVSAEKRLPPQEPRRLSGSKYGVLPSGHLRLQVAITLQSARLAIGWWDFAERNVVEYRRERNTF